MATAVIHKNDIGVTLRYTVKDQDDAVVDISSDTTPDLLAKPPDGGTLKTFVGSHVTDGTNGQLEYVTIAGDLDTAGEWKIQVSLAGVSGFTGRSTIDTFTVADILS